MTTSTSSISADTAAITSAVGRYRRQARSLRALGKSVDTVSFPVHVPGGTKNKSEAINHLMVAAKLLEEVASRTEDFVKRLVWAETYASRNLPQLAALIGKHHPMYNVLPEGTEAWGVRGTGALLFVEAELGVTVAITPLANGKFRMTVVATKGLGLTAGVGMSAGVGEEIGASAEVSLMAMAKSGRVYEISEDQRDSVLAYESAMALGHGAPEIAGRYIKVRPVAEFRSGGVSAAARTEVLSLSKGAEADVSKVVTTHRNGSVTTTYVVGGTVDASMKGVGPKGDVRGSLSITRGRDGQVISVESVRSQGITLGAEHSDKLHPGGGGDSKDKTKPKTTTKGTIGMSVDAREETRLGINVGAANPNSLMQAKLEDLAKHPVRNRAEILDLLHESGSGEVVVSATVNNSVSAGAKFALGAKLEASATINKSNEVVLSSEPVLPK